MGRGAGQEIVNGVIGGVVSGVIGEVASHQIRKMNDTKVRDQIRDSLTPELVKPEYRDNPRPYAGHCYVASEAYYHLKGGPDSDLKVKGMLHEGAQHWWIETSKGEVIDLTAERFETPVPYEQGKGRGFLTKQPSKRAQVVMRRVLEKADGKRRTTRRQRSN